MMPRWIPFVWCLLVPSLSQAVSIAEYPYLEDLVARLVSEHGLDRDRLVETFEQMSLRPA